MRKEDYSCTDGDQHHGCKVGQDECSYSQKSE
jgi:hypothetical protein